MIDGTSDTIERRDMWGTLVPPVLAATDHIRRQGNYRLHQHHGEGHAVGENYHFFHMEAFLYMVS